MLRQQQHGNDNNASGATTTTPGHHLISRRHKQTDGATGNHCNENHQHTNSTQLLRADSNNHDADDEDDVVAALHRRIKIATENNKNNFVAVNKKSSANGGFNLRGLIPQTQTALPRQNHRRHPQQPVATSKANHHATNNNSQTHRYQEHNNIPNKNNEKANAVVVAADVVVDDVDMLEEAIDVDAEPPSSQQPHTNHHGNAVPNAAVFLHCDSSNSNDLRPNSIISSTAAAFTDSQSSSITKTKFAGNNKNAEAVSSPSSIQQHSFPADAEQQQRHQHPQHNSPLLLSSLSAPLPPTPPSTNPRLPTNSRVQTDFDVLMPNGTFTTLTNSKNSFDSQQQQQQNIQSVKQYIRHFNGKAAEITTAQAAGAPSKQAQSPLQQTQQQILQSGLTSILLGTFNNAMQQPTSSSKQPHLSFNQSNNHNHIDCDRSSAAEFFANTNFGGGSGSNGNHILLQQQNPLFSNDKMVVDDGDNNNKHDDGEENEDDGIDDDYDDQEEEEDEEEYGAAIVTTTVEDVFNSASADPAAEGAAVDQNDETADHQVANADEQAAEEESRHSVEPPDDDHGGEMRVDPEVVVIEDDEELPWGWQKRMSRTSGKPYYLNLFSKKSQWHAPSTPGWISPTHHENDWPKVCVAHVLIRHKESRRPMTWRGTAVGRSLEEAIQLAWTYRDMIALQQMSFEDAAGQFSDCGSARQAGEIGWITKGHMHRAFEEQAFALGIGDVCEAPVLTKTGVHIIKRIG